jgi:hypothetical protein
VDKPGTSVPAYLRDIDGHVVQPLVRDDQYLLDAFWELRDPFDRGRRSHGKLDPDQVEGRRMPGQGAEQLTPARPNVDHGARAALVGQAADRGGEQVAGVHRRPEVIGRSFAPEKAVRAVERVLHRLPPGRPRHVLNPTAAKAPRSGSRPGSASQARCPLPAAAPDRVQGTHRFGLLTAWPGHATAAKSSASRRLAAVTAGPHRRSLNLGQADVRWSRG